MIRRFPLRRSRLFLIPASASVEVTDETLTVSLGWVRITVARAEIEWARREERPWWFGSDFVPSVRGGVVIATPGAVVHARLRRGKLTLLAMIPSRLRDLYLGVEDVDGLIAVIASTA